MCCEQIDTRADTPQINSLQNENYIEMDFTMSPEYTEDIIQQDSRGSTPHAIDEIESCSVNVVHAPDSWHTTNMSDSKVKILEGHVLYLSPTEGFKYMLRNDAIKILLDRIEYD